MAKRSSRLAQPDMFQAALTTAPCVPAIREAVAAWRAKSYAGATDTSRLLLDFWFKTEHRLRGGVKFKYHDAQRDAVETLVWLYEVAKVRRQRALVERFATRPDLRLLQHDTFPRYALKMATGSGKTKVMSLVFAWQYFNRVAEGRTDYAATGLLIAPNVIVYERLASDFASGKIFRTDPVVPDALRTYWDVDVYLRGEPERAGSLGALYVANIQQLYDREDDAPAPVNPVAALLGALPPSQLGNAEPFAERIAQRGGPCLVLNDEAHHTHDEDSTWNETIRMLHTRLGGAAEGERGVVQLDVSATPRHTGGALFSWTVFDYPLKQAILDNVVKRPVKGLIKGIAEQQSDIANIRYRPYLVAAVERWKEYRASLDKTGRKPLLFVMMNSTAEADDVAGWMREAYPDLFGDDRLAVIHTGRDGDVAKKDLDLARRVAREVDANTSPVNAIVSVLMLREGWDVQSVTVVVGLRPYTAKANILPEQAIGRGLRLMFRGQLAGFTERVDIIGNAKFMEFVEQLEKEEALELETFEPGKDKVVIAQIYPDPEKLDVDVALPQLSAILTRKKSLADEIAALDLPAPTPPLPLRAGSKEAQLFRYEGLDIVTLERTISAEYTMPEPQTAQEVIGFYARLIASGVKLPAQFAALAPKVRAYLAEKAFGRALDLESKESIRALAQQVVGHVVVREFTKALRPLLVEPQMPEIVGEAKRVSETPGFPWTRPTLASAKCVLNLVPCENAFEHAFAVWLDACDDVRAFVKIPDPMGFSIPYTDSRASLRHYEPDFVAVLDDGAHFLLETKGREDLDVQHKDRAARLWCEHATALTGQPWQYIKVPQKAFEAMQPQRFEDLVYLDEDA